MKSENFRHTVFFWLKEPNNQSHRTAFETSLTKFIECSEFVQNKHLGIPANTYRQVIDATYTYCLALSFLNKQDQDNYQVEPAHKIFIEESEALWEKVLVYDSENIW
tara:strand:- start:14224 stop:14544 length:321 start_codon:yes stop_codon:yes gene_type:complete